MKKKSAVPVTPSARHIMREPAVLALVGISHTTLFAMMKRGRFPRSVSIGNGTRARGWDSRVVEKYIDATLDGRKWSDDVEASNG